MGMTARLGLKRQYFSSWICPIHVEMGMTARLGLKLLFLIQMTMRS